MKKNSYDNISTFVEAGESAAAKSETTGKLVSAAYSEGMKLLTGDGMTTSCDTEVIIDPHVQEACVIIYRITKDEIHLKMMRNLQIVLVPEIRNVISSLPYDDDEALERFVKEAVERRSKLQDEKFRVHKLLVNKYSDYYNYLYIIFKSVFMKAAEKSFRYNCNEAAKETKKEVTRLIEQLISNMLDDDDDDDDCKKAVTNLIELIESEIAEVLKESVFVPEENELMCYTGNNLNPEQFINTIKIISNSQRKELAKTPSIACALKSVQLIMPGCGINTGSGELSAYRLIDIVGFTNDGLSNVEELVNKAMLSQYNYDGIIYFASKRTINKTHESFLREILMSMRPAKLILISTFMDTDDIFDEEEVPTSDMINELNSNRAQELLDIVKKVATDDLHIVLPSKEDVICISNKVNRKRHGESACMLYGPEQYNLIRHALERAVNVIRRKIYSGVNKTSQYLIPVIQVSEIIGQLVNQLGSSIDREYSILRDFSAQIHHWTLDAILWNMLNGRQHISDAKVWRNVQISTFTNMQQICLDNLSDFKFSPDVKIGRQEDSNRVKSEFIANLNTELYWVVRDIILKDPTDTNKPSICRDTICKLAVKSKYNKWRIVEDLRLCLLKAVAQPDYLEEMLNKSIKKALLATYEKLLY